MKTLLFNAKAMGLLLAGRVVTPAMIREDYDRLSAGYDEAFGRHMRKHALELTERLRLRPGDRALDLASGTGNVALALAAAVGPTGSVTGTDSSAGMLARAETRRRDYGNDWLRFREADMRQALLAQPDASLDVATCGWAIGYESPPSILRLMARKLKPGGRVGLIENARDTLAPIRDASLTVARAYPGQVRRIMDLHRRLPRNVRQMGRWCQAAGLTVLDVWEGSEEFRFGSGAEALAWVLRTGAGAGFWRMMDPARKSECDALFARYLDERFADEAAIPAAHHWLACVARKEGAPCI